MLTLCVIVAILGVVLIALGLLPATSGHIPGGVGTGISLLAVGVVLYVVLAVTGVA